MQLRCYRIINLLLLNLIPFKLCVCVWLQRPSVLKFGSCWNCCCNHFEISHFVMLCDFPFQSYLQFSAHHTDPGGHDCNSLTALCG
jgi:hypothetical protein